SGSGTARTSAACCAARNRASADARWHLKVLSGLPGHGTAWDRRRSIVRRNRGTGLSRSLLLRVCPIGFTRFTVAARPRAEPHELTQLVEQFQKWLFACAPADDQKPARCELFQQMTKRETGQRVFRLAFRAVEGGAVEAFAMAPFGLKLSAGITFQV